MLQQEQQEQDEWEREWQSTFDVFVMALFEVIAIPLIRPFDEYRCARSDVDDSCFDAKSGGTWKSNRRRHRQTPTDSMHCFKRKSFEKNKKSAAESKKECVAASDRVT